MEEVLHDVSLFREFAGLNWDTALSDNLSVSPVAGGAQVDPQILALVEELLDTKGLLRVGTAVDATLIAEPSSTKNASGERDPQMKQSKKRSQWHFGMKAHIGLGADSGLVHTVRGTTSNVSDVIEGDTVLHGEETEA